MDSIDRLIKLDFFYFKLDLSAPLKEKEGIALFAQTEKGFSSWSEVAPLPFFSKESLLDALEELFFLREIIFSNDLTLEESLFLLDEHPFSPSTLFGVESLLSFLMAPIQKKAKQIPLCALLLGSFEEIQKQIPKILKEGYSSAKLKVSGLSFDAAHTLIEALRGKIELKIDVNRAWSLEKSLSFFSKYPKTTFKYIEEPVQRVEELPLFPYPIALDETIREHKMLPSIKELKALIIKPMLMGGKNQIETFLKTFSPSLDVIFSSSYESGIGLFHLFSLYEKLNIPLHPLGTDTYKMITQDLLTTPHTCNRGLLTKNPLNVRKNLLKKLKPCLIS